MWAASHWSQSCFYSFYDDTFLLVAAVTCRFSCHITKGKFYQPDVTDLRKFLSSTVADILLYWHFAILATSWTSYHIKGLLFGSYSAWANRDFPHMMDLLQIVNEWSPLTSQEGGGGGWVSASVRIWQASIKKETKDGPIEETSLRNIY